MATFATSPKLWPGLNDRLLSEEIKLLDLESKRLEVDKLCMQK